MKKLNLILGVLAMVVLMFVNVSFGTFEQAYPNIKVETVEANDQIDQAEGKWAVVDCGPGHEDVCAGDGEYICCK